MAEMRIVMTITKDIEFTPGEMDSGYDHLGPDATAQDYVDFEVNGLNPEHDDYRADPGEFAEEADTIEVDGKLIRE